MSPLTLTKPQYTTPEALQSQTYMGLLSDGHDLKSYRHGGRYGRSLLFLEGVLSRSSYCGWRMRRRYLLSPRGDTPIGHTLPGVM